MPFTTLFPIKEINFYVMFLEEKSSNFYNDVKKYFEEKGYIVQKSKKYFVGFGIPDLYVYNNNDSFFVEIKGIRGDGLRDTQIKWLIMHGSKYKTIVVYKERNKRRSMHVLP